MRTPSLLGSTRLSRKIWSSFLLMTTTVAAATAITKPIKITQPSFNLDDLGRVGLAGDFTGISLYEYAGQGQSSYTNGSHSIMTQLPNGLFTPLGLADSGISAMCVYELMDGTVKGVVVGGNFTSLGGVEAKGIALYNAETGEVEPMGYFNGKVTSLLCDKDTSRVYVGGSFTLNDSQNAVAWENGKWQSLPFQGFTDPVQTIAKSSNNTIIFGGSFNGLRNFSASVVAVKDAQTVNLVSAEIQAEQSTTSLPGFGDPDAIVCTNSTEKQWLVQDGKLGSWTANFRFQFKPTKLRLINSNYQGRSTETFRFTAFPLNGIMNLTYTDPETGKKGVCEAWCPLAATDKPQDFEFINNVGMNSFRLDLLKFRGAGTGLSSVQLFQDDIYSFAIPELNEPACSAGPIRSGSVTTDQWDLQKDNVEADSDYLKAGLDATARSSSKVVFEPHIEQRGRYQVLLYTPGCIQDGSCSTRGKVDITGVLTKDGKPIPSFPIYQTNYYDKYDTVYDSVVDPADENFRPQITLTPAPEQTQAVVNIVAQKVQFKLVDALRADQSATSGSSNTSSSADLNGLYEYAPSKPEATDPNDSIISMAGSQLSKGASVAAVLIKDNVTYVGGNFTDKRNSFSHFTMIDQKGPLKNVAENGLNGPVNTMLIYEDLIYIGGHFSGTNAKNTRGAAFICAYDTKKNVWIALGSGLNGVVTKIVPISLNLGGGNEDCLAVSGGFSKIQPNGDSANVVGVAGFAVWVPSKNKWLENMNTTAVKLSGLLSAEVQTNQGTIYAGSISSSSVSASGSVYLRPSDSIGVEATPLKYISSKDNTLQKRDTQIRNFTGIAAGIFYVTGNKNLTILGGRFQAQGKDGPINTLAFIDGNTGQITGASSEFDIQSTVRALAIYGQSLYVGGTLKGQKNIGGIAIWDLVAMQLADDQPMSLSGNNATVYAITHRPSTQDMYVAGDFNAAGPLACVGLCIYQTDRQQWTDASPDSPGVVKAMHWVNRDLLIIGGKLQLNNTDLNLAMFDAIANKFIAFDGNVTNIPGPVTDIAVDSDSSKSLFIAGVSSKGGPYLMKLQDGTFTELESKFDAATVIDSIQVMKLNTYRGDSAHLKNGYLLMITGSLYLTGFGRASAVTFDGFEWKPLLLTSKDNGEPGKIATLFSQREQTFTNGSAKLAKGYVILISLAIALALVFLLVVFGVLASYVRRQREGYIPAPTIGSAEKSVAMQDRLPPEELLHGVSGSSPGAPRIY